MRRPSLRRLAIPALLVGVLVVPTAVWGATPHQQTPTPTTSAPSEQVEAGRRLFETNCATCHGKGGVGTSDAPSLVGVGAASADFYLSTGRMPLPVIGQRARRKRPAFDRGQIDQLVAYVASLGDGPPIPRLDTSDADIAKGGELFRLNCASCHGFAGTGGALSEGNQAPPIWDATPTQVLEAIRIGPGTMPVFSQTSLSDEDAAAVTRYATYLKDPNDRGGNSLEYAGPIPEGLVAWLLGLGSLIGFSVWIGRTR
jgi:ubiquinol-cytochrome c reductase cytochrome c subunit